MEKSFWFDVRANNYELPEGSELLPLTEELFSYLGSTDPELRDTIAYETFANWLEQSLYSPDLLRGYCLRLQMNLQEGLGEAESDTLFLRAFSVLSLAEIVDRDNRNSFLDGDEVKNLLSKALAYLEAERDPRGYVPGKGWGHALAHTADLLFVLAASPRLHAEELSRILSGMAAKLAGSNYWIYVHGEDDRLVRAVMTVFRRDLLDAPTLEAWLKSLTHPGGVSWKAAFANEGRMVAFFNVRNFLRSLALHVVGSTDLPHKETFQALLLDANSRMRT
jgi:hypothetical protein